MKFKLEYHDEDRQYLILDAYKVKVTIAFKDGEVWYVNLNDNEFEPHDDILYGLSVSLGEFPYITMFPISYVMQEAINQYEDLMEETRREISDGSMMSAELSSPYQTGRI